MALKRCRKAVCSALLAGGLLLSLFPVLALGAEAETESAPFEGYLVKVEAPSATTKKLMRARPAAPDSVEGVEATQVSGVYHADDLDAAVAAVELAGRATVVPNYVRTLPESGWELMGGAAYSATALHNVPHLELIHAITQGETGYEMDLDRGLDRDPSPMGTAGTGADEIVIAVIDTGLILGHEDIPYDRIRWPDRTTPFLANVGLKGDSKGHGTFITGQILAAVNSIGIDGVAPKTCVMPLRVFGAGDTTDEAVLDALQYAIDQKTSYAAGTGGSNVCVINMSLGGPLGSALLKEKVDAAIEAGIIVICAAGNNGTTAATYPAQYAIGVGACDPDGGLDDATLAHPSRSYSQKLSKANQEGWQNKVWVSAPGTNYGSTWPRNLWPTGTINPSWYAVNSGTSFAAPLVSALAATAVSLRNDLTSLYDYEEGEETRHGRVAVTGEEITNNHYSFKELLYETAMAGDSGQSLDGQDVYYGWGVIDYAAVIDVLARTQVAILVRDGEGSPVEGAQVTLYGKDETGAWDETAPLAHETTTRNGHTVYSLPWGSGCHYVVSAPGFDLLEGDLALGDGNAYLEHPVTLRPAGSLYDVTFLNAPRGAEITVRSGEETLPVEDGACQLPNGTYALSVRAVGYVPLDDTFTVRGTDRSVDVGLKIHSPHVETAVDTQPTCTEGGFTTYTCTVCGATRIGAPVGALGHLAGTPQEEDRKEPTCTEVGGYDTATYCQTCGAELSRKHTEIPAKGHVPGEIQEENRKDATCPEPGGYDQVRYCTVCQAEIGREHVVIPQLGHSPGEPQEEERQEPTCTQVGGYDLATYCQTCGNETSRTHVELPAKGHSPGEPGEEERQEPTCTTAGGYALVTRCQTCGVELSREQKDLPAKGHVAGAPREEDWQAPTCTGDGEYDEVIYCENCHAELSRSPVTLQSLGHAFGPPEYQWGRDDRSVTATRVCARDPGHVETETVIVQRRVIRAATATESGLEIYTATFTNPAFETQTKEKTLPATGVLYYPSGMGASPVTSAPQETAEPAEQTGTLEPSLLEPAAGGGSLETVQPLSEREEDAETRQIRLAAETYDDVAETAWYASSVGYVTEKKLFGGTDPGVFSPDVPMTRAMLVTVLYRLEGEPEVVDLRTFTDVGRNKYYTKAVAWAAQNEIVSGMGKGIFDPHGCALREQMAVILYQYARYKGWALKESGDLSRFEDEGEIADWARRAMEWACGAGILSGRKATRLAPEGYSTRAETAAMLMRLCALLERGAPTVGRAVTRECLELTFA